jgi:hypothetical protein
MCGARDLASAMGAKPKQTLLSQQQQAQQQAAMEITKQNRALVDQLKGQAQLIADQTAARQRELEAAQAPGQTVVNANPYTVSLGQGTAGAGQEQTTAPAMAKKKPGQKLSITADITMPGVGLNLGA